MPLSSPAGRVEKMQNPLRSTDAKATFAFDDVAASHRPAAAASPQPIPVLEDMRSSCEKPLRRGGAFRVLPKYEDFGETAPPVERAPTPHETSETHRVDLLGRMRLATPTAATTAAVPRTVPCRAKPRPPTLAPPVGTHKRPELTSQEDATASQTREPMDSLLFFFDGLGETEAASSLLPTSVLLTPEMRSPSLSAEKAPNTLLSPVVTKTHTNAAPAAAATAPQTTAASPSRTNAGARALTAAYKPRSLIVTTAEPSEDRCVAASVSSTPLASTGPGPITRSPLVLSTLRQSASDVVVPRAPQPPPNAQTEAFSTLTFDVPMSFLLSSASTKIDTSRPTSFASQNELETAHPRDGHVTAAVICGRIAVWSESARAPLSLIRSHPAPALAATPTTEKVETIADASAVDAVTPSRALLGMAALPAVPLPPAMNGADIRRGRVQSPLPPITPRSPSYTHTGASLRERLVEGAEHTTRYGSAFLSTAPSSCSGSAVEQSGSATNPAR